MRPVATLRLVLAFSFPLVATAQTDPATSRLRSSVELQLHNFGNFYQAGPGESQVDVNATGAAYRLAWTRPERSPDVYGRAFVLRYTDDASETSYGAQIGTSKYGSVHWYDVSLDWTKNGYAFDIDETRARADLTSLTGHYSYRVAPNWRVGTDLYLEQTRFDDHAEQASDYGSIGVDVRYRGRSELFQPRIGYVAGRRNAEDPDEEAADRSWFAELRSEVHPSVDLRLRYRDRNRDYEFGDRVDDRTQWTLRAIYKQNARLAWTGVYMMENVDSTDPGRDFDRNVASVYLTWAF